MNAKEKKVVKDVNLECAMKVSKRPSSNLNDILNLYSVEYLMDFYETITEDTFVGNKKKLVNTLYATLTSKDYINRIFNSLSLKEFNILMNIVENDGCIQDDYVSYLDYSFISNFGVVYKFNYKNRLYIIIPDEIINVINELNVSEFDGIVSENSKIITLAYAMCNLYGVVPIELFIEACEKYYNIVDINFDCILYAKRGNSINFIFDNNEDGIYLVKEEYLEDNNLNNVYKIIDNYNDILCRFDFKEIEIEDLIKYEDIFYYKKNASSERMANFLRGYGYTEDIIEDIIASIVQTFKNDWITGFSILNDILLDYDLVITADNYDEFMFCFNNLINEIPMWGSKGWTSKELILKNVND